MAVVHADKMKNSHTLQKMTVFDSAHAGNQVLSTFNQPVQHTHCM